MHTLVMKRSLAAEHPDLPAQLFELFCQAKKIGRGGTKSDWRAGLVWKDSYLEEEERFFGGDPWVYGLEKNQHVLEKLIAYCYAQGVAAAQLSPKELFLPGTWDLVDSD
jgi:4,5-dihydroxyphthalate decarboxylase